MPVILTAFFPCHSLNLGKITCILQKNLRYLLISYAFADLESWLFPLINHSKSAICNLVIRIMALIKCSGCGHMVSDKAKACPHCGTPVETNGDPVNANPENPNTTPEAPVVHYVKPERNNNTMLIALIVMGVVALLGICGWLWYDNQQKRAELERQLAEQAEQARQDSIAAAELREQLRQDSIAKAKKQGQIDNIYNEYVRVLKQHHDGKYFLFDINKDRIPELWMHAYNQNELKTGYDCAPLHIFTIRENRVKTLDREGLFLGYEEARFYQGNNCIIVSSIWDGDGFCIKELRKISYSGDQIVSKTIREYDCEEEEVHISEPKIPELDLTDYDALKRQIKSYFQD